MPNCPRQDRFDHKAVMCAFNAHVRSVLEYASVIWSGAAVTHLARLERLQHRFLMWLGARTQSQCPPMDYDSLLLLFNTMSIKARFIQADIMFMYKVLHQRIDSDFLVSLFVLNVPGRRSRHTAPVSFMSRLGGQRSKKVLEWPTPFLRASFLANSFF